MNKSIVCVLFLCDAFAFGGCLNVYGQKGYKTTATEKRVRFWRGKTSIVLASKIKNRNNGIIYLVNVGETKIERPRDFGERRFRDLHRHAGQPGRSRSDQTRKKLKRNNYENG